MTVLARVPLIAAAGILALMGLAAPAWALTVPALSSPWPQFSGNPALTGTESAETSITMGNVGQLTQAWTTELPADSYDSEPVLGGGLVFAGAGDTLTALDAGTGAVVWSKTLRGDVVGTPAVAGGLVLVAEQKVTGTRHTHVADYVAALRISTGQTAWLASVSGVGGPSLSSSDSSLTVTSGRAYLIEGDGQVVALDVANGLQAWESAAVPGCSPSQPAVSGGYVVVGSGGTNVTALNAADGSVAWTQSFGSGCGGSAENWAPAISQGKVYAGLLNGVASLALSTGDVVMRNTRVGSVFFPLSLADHDLIFDSSHGLRLEAARQGRGGIVWRASLTHFVAQVTTFGGLSWGLSRSSGNQLVQVVAIDTATGQVDYTSASYSDATQAFAPVVSAGHVYVNLGGEVLCLALPAGG
jgi:outer membrane protein assembly factor BamB